MTNQKNLSILAIVNAIALVGVLAMNYLAAQGSIGGNTTGEVSAAYDNLFTPAGFTFSIWGLIYLGLAFFVGYQIRQAFRAETENPDKAFIGRIGIWFIVSCVANIAWIFAWHNEVLWLSVLLMFLILFSLLAVYIQIPVGERTVTTATRWFVHVPFSLYLGWISVATIANIAVFLTAAGWDGLGISEIFWSALLITIAVLLGMRMLFWRGDIIYAAVIAWAAFGIYSKLNMDDIKALPWVPIAGIVILLIAIAWALIRKRSYLQVR